MVFWFGDPSKVPHPPSGLRPTTPQEMEEMLEAQLSKDEGRTITIHVVDCSIS